MTATGATPDPVDELIKVLAESQDFTSIEVAETLWLAMQMESTTTVLPEIAATSAETDTSAASELELGEAPWEPEAIAPPPPAPKHRANIVAPTAKAGVLPPKTLPIWLADPAMLTDALAIIRALKPLLQKIDSGAGRRLNESATVDTIARTRLCIPILEPQQAPWFDIVLVVDRGSSMHIWQRLVQDIVRILRRYGAFRDVRVFDLVINSAAAKPEDAVLLEAIPNRLQHRPRELIDQRGQRIAVVLSDCAGAYWWNGTLLPMLEAWGASMPTAIWQMLPAWMWQRTALGRGVAVAISNDLPGVANQRLQVQARDRDQTEPKSPRLALPVITSEVADLSRWSQMLMGDRRSVTSGFRLPPPGGSVPRSRTYEELAEARAQQVAGEADQATFQAAYEEALVAISRERVERFLTLSSPVAKRLIMLLSAAPVITLPVVRLIRDAMLPDVSSPLPVAEVFLSGLLQRLPGQDPDQLTAMLATEPQASTQIEETAGVNEHNESAITADSTLDVQDFVQYDFMPEVRAVLLEFLPAVDAVEVINNVSTEVERRWNRITDQDFRAFLTNPTEPVPEELAGMRSFASITADILKQLGGDYAEFAQTLGGPIEPPPGSIEEDSDWLADLDLQPLTYEVAEYLNFPAITDFDFTETELVEDKGEDFPPPLQPDDFRVVTVELSPPEPSRELFEFTVAYLQQQRAGGGWFGLGGLVPLGLGGAGGPGDDREWTFTRYQQQAYRFIEALPDNISLEMVSIPGGTFLMGSPADEPERDADLESPQHEVTVPPFFMGRYPVTQEQWRVVVNLPQINRELDADPSSFKGDRRPVEKVSWHDAVEFCDRLSAHTGRQYRLPSEAEWEYACRAGTTTPFYFGDMITTEVANYNGSAYANGPQGERRDETTQVDHFGIANALGLSDMHGNVFEWCADHWHRNYDGAPTDGSAWIEGGNSSLHVRRGGSWNLNPRDCRSAYRVNHYLVNRNNYIGFRVVCSSPRALQ